MMIMMMMIQVGFVIEFRDVKRQELNDKRIRFKGLGP